MRLVLICKGVIYCFHLKRASRPVFCSRKDAFLSEPLVWLKTKKRTLRETTKTAAEVCLDICTIILYIYYIDEIYNLIIFRLSGNADFFLFFLLFVLFFLYFCPVNLNINYRTLKFIVMLVAIEFVGLRGILRFIKEYHTIFKSLDCSYRDRILNVYIQTSDNDYLFRTFPCSFDTFNLMMNKLYNCVLPYISGNPFPDKSWSSLDVYHFRF